MALTAALQSPFTRIWSLLQSACRTHRNRTRAASPGGKDKTPSALTSATEKHSVLSVRMNYSLKTKLQVLCVADLLWGVWSACSHLSSCTPVVRWASGSSEGQEMLGPGTQLWLHLSIKYIFNIIYIVSRFETYNKLLLWNVLLEKCVCATFH